MKNAGLAVLFVSAIPVQFLGTSVVRADGEVTYGERLDPSTYGPGVIETMAMALERDRTNPPLRADEPDRRGLWLVPSRRATSFPHSGEHNVVNKWGDPRMGIGFGQRVDVHGAFFSGQAGEGAWTTGVRAIGYRDGEVISKTDWFCGIGEVATWFEMNLENVDRVEIVATPVLEGGGWYGMDDFTYAFGGDLQDGSSELVVLDFEDLSFNTTLAGLFIAKSEFDNATLESDELFSLQFGFTSWLAEGLYIEPTVGFGLNGPGDSFFAGVTLPYSFGM